MLNIFDYIKHPLGRDFFGTTSTRAFIFLGFYIFSFLRPFFASVVGLVKKIKEIAESDIKKKEKMKKRK